MKKKKNKTIEELCEELKLAYHRWGIHARGGQCNYGCGDGAMMNMERRNIIHLQDEIHNIDPDMKLPDIPDEVDRNLWINMELWDQEGRKLLKKYKDDKDYNYLLSVIDKLDSKQKKSIHIDTVIAYVHRFEEALNGWRSESNNEYDYKWYLRRHVSAPYFDAFSDCVKRVKKLLAETGISSEPPKPSKQNVEYENKEKKEYSFTVAKNGQLCFSF